MKTKLTICFCMLATIGKLSTYGQSQDAKPDDYGNMSLKDLLNVKIVSVSKSSELLFDAPLSASVVTRDDIRKAGCTSIMEALRLVPGMIVRQQTNGNYDIQLRGVYTTPNALFDGSSATMLVMIDSRPIFNYLKGSTFWETLPVDLNDVEKIEVVRGPAAALYGPNALTGVINIITREAQKEGLYLIANSQQGSRQTFINNASVGYRKGKWDAIASGNYQHRNRTQTSYFEFNRNQWFEHPDSMIGSLGYTVYGIDKIFPRPELAMEKYAGNLFVNYKASEKAQYNLSAGTQNSTVQKVFAESGLSPITETMSESRYADLRANIGGMSAQFSYINGTQVADQQPGNKYDFNTLDAIVGYNYSRGDFSLKPGLSYRSAVYDDTKYSDVINKSGMFNAKGEIITRSAYLKSEYKLFNNKLRLVAGVAVSHFNYPDTAYLSYEFAATYKPHKKHLFRIVYSKAPRSSTIYETYIDQNINEYQVGYQKYMQLRYEGNRKLGLLTNRMMEIGYRGTIATGLFIDAEVFEVYSKNYVMATINATYMKMNGADTLLIVPLNPTNIPMTGPQHGMTISLTYSTKKVQLKPFITIQKTIVKDYAPYAVTPDASPGFLQSDPAKYNIYSGIGTQSELKSAPAVFGGGYFNYSVSTKLNLNVDAYYYSSQTVLHATNIIFNDGVRGIDHISSKLLLNTTVSYQALKELNLFISAKNILNNQSREYYKADKVPAMFLAGINLEF